MFLCVHDDRSVPSDGFLQFFSSKEHGAGLLTGTSCQGYFSMVVGSGIKQNDGSLVAVVAVVIDRFESALVDIQ